MTVSLTVIGGVREVDEDLTSSAHSEESCADGHDSNSTDLDSVLGDLADLLVIQILEVDGGLLRVTILAGLDELKLNRATEQHFFSFYLAKYVRISSSVIDEKSILEFCLSNRRPLV